MKPFLIGIAGPSCAGKTELSKALAMWLPPGTPIVSLDSYYHNLDHLTLEQRASVNFDHPNSLDWGLILSDVRRLAAGKAIDEPVYLFDKHTRAEQARHVASAPYVILEGLFALYNQEVREQFDAKYFVTAPMDLCLNRRRRRDVMERGRTAESVDRQFRETVQPMAERFVIPTQEYADLVLSGEVPVEESMRLVREHVRALTGGVPAACAIAAGLAG